MSVMLPTWKGNFPQKGGQTIRIGVERDRDNNKEIKCFVVVMKSARYPSIQAKLLRESLEVLLPRRLSDCQATE